MVDPHGRPEHVLDGLTQDLSGSAPARGTGSLSSPASSSGLARLVG